MARSVTMTFTCRSVMRFIRESHFTSVKISLTLCVLTSVSIKSAGNRLSDWEDISAPFIAKCILTRAESTLNASIISSGRSVGEISLKLSREKLRETMNTNKFYFQSFKISLNKNSALRYPKRRRGYCKTHSQDVIMEIKLESIYQKFTMFTIQMVFKRSTKAFICLTQMIKWRIKVVILEFSIDLMP